MFNVKVATSFANGTIINFDANDALNFMIGLSITVINTVRDTIKEGNKFGNMDTKSCDPDVMHLIEHYNTGNPGSIYTSILQTNASILLSFVQDVVLNDTTRGLYLFCDRNRKNDAAPYELIVKALEDVHQYYMQNGNRSYQKSNYFNRYNDEFLSLIRR